MLRIPRWSAWLMLVIGLCVAIWPVLQILQVWLVLRPFGGFPDDFWSTNAGVLIPWALWFALGIAFIVVSLLALRRRTV